MSTVKTQVVNTEIKHDVCKEILVVDDNADNLKLLHSLLMDKGFKVRLANNGGMALKSIRAKQPDLILLDITMPVMSGFEVCQQLKLDKLTANIPVIFLSALKEEADVIHGFSMGGVDFVNKPFKSEILLARIATHLKMNGLQTKLEDLNHELQHRVADRTKKIIQTNNELSISEARLKYALTASNEGIWDWDVRKNKIYYSDTYFTMLGYDADNFRHEPGVCLSLLHPDDKERYQEQIDYLVNKDASDFKVDYRLRKHNDDYCWILSQGMVVEKDSNDQPSRIIGTHTDISNEKNTQEHLRKLASYDPLTKLANRTLFLDNVSRSIARAQRKNSRHAILFLDLDRFKHINDSLGHTAGDQLLIHVSNCLSTIFRDDDVVARLGGDEFTVLLQDISEVHQVTDTAKRILSVLNRPIDILGHQVVVSVSIGIVLYPDNATTPEILLQNADTAMYYAKRDGGSCYSFFTDEMNRDAQNHLRLEESLRSGIEEKEIILHYQPQVSTTTGKIVSMEALCRWEKGSGEIILPNEFIPIAEETGLILPIGNLIFEQIFQAVKHWSDNSLFNQRIAINISARQFKQKDLLENIMRILEGYKISPECLEFEITEATIMVSTEESINIMKKIKNCGITLAIDDFGTGYSSLGYLKNFPIDTLKIDKCFIKDMELSNVDKSIVETIINLGHNLNLQVVAEGVETKNQAHLLASMGCDTLQGYLFSKPVATKEMERLLKEDLSN